MQGGMNMKFLWEMTGKIFGAEAQDGPFFCQFIIKQAKFYLCASHIDADDPFFYWIILHHFFPEYFLSPVDKAPSPHYSPSVSDGG